MAEAERFCPYVGLRPFREEDQPYFFGREHEIGVIIDNLFGARLTVFYGASGVGKSSVLMAGVVPRLRQEPRTAVVVFRSWQMPNATQELKRRVVETVPPAAARSFDIHSGLPLDDLLARAAEALDGTILLLLDQFEEFFLYLPDTGEAAAFDAELARAITRRDIDAGFLISLREDHLSRLDRFRKYVPTLLSNTQRLEHLSLDAARSAIEQPLQEYNRRHPQASGGAVRIDGELVEELLRQTSTGQVSIAQLSGAAEGERQAGTGRVEAPYLQLVLERLWKEEIEAGSRTLRLETLAALGGAKTIVSTHLDQVLERLTPTDRELCARVFDRLVTPSGGKIACRLGDLGKWAGDLAGEVPRLTALLDQNRVLARISAPPGAPEGDDQYQIFHDVLAPGIVDWRQRFLHQKTTAEAEAAAAERERAAAEEQRQIEWEAARERELALAQESAGKERRLRRRLQLAAGVAIVGLLLAAVMASLATVRAGQLEAARDAARQEAEAAKKAQAALEVETIRDEYRKTRNYESAIAGLGRIVDALDPQSAAAYALRGRVYAEHADQQGAGYDAAAAKSAIADLERSLALDPAQPDVLVTLAEVRRAGGDLAGALAAYDRAITLAPDDPQLYYNRGALRAAANDDAGAVADYTAAIQRRPAFDDAYLARADLYQKEGKSQEAVTDLRQAIQYADDDRTRVAAEARLRELGEQATPQREKILVYVHYVAASDRGVAEEVRRALQSAYRVERVELVERRRTSGDVRYFVTDDQARLREDERAAADIAQTVEQTLAQAGYKVSIQTIPLEQKKWTLARPGLVEVWIPSLSRAVPQLMQKAY